MRKSPANLKKKLNMACFSYEKIMAIHQANKAWHEAQEADAAHPYLVSHQILPYGVRQYEDMLLVPAESAEGRLLSVLAIFGVKDCLFPRHSYIKGTAFVIGDYKAEADKKVILCSDYASAVSLHMATQLPTLAAFFGWNYVNVIREHEALDPSRIILADSHKGVRNAQFQSTVAEVAKEYRCPVLLPKFKEETVQDMRVTKRMVPKTWNDLHVVEGLEAVKTQITKAMTFNQLKKTA